MQPLTAAPPQDFPMPAEYPDFPSQAQMLAYIRAYAEHKGLRTKITCVAAGRRTGGWGA